VLKKGIFICALAWALFSRAGAIAAITSPLHSTDSSDQLAAQIKQQLAHEYVGARVELTSGFAWTRGSMPSEIANVTLIGEGGGEARFSVRGGTGYAEGAVRFAAFVQAPIALRRVLPGERLNADMFQAQEINVAMGMAHEYRGVILPVGMDVSSLEARQTILEGQYPLSTGVQKVPDVRRGDAVRIQLNSGDVILSTMGTASEPAYIGSQLRVVSAKTKHELVGKLKKDGIVEVQL
jgi:flagella basal body P-ring formation protein FlgA